MRSINPKSYYLQIIIAHRDKHYTSKLKKGLFEKGFKDIHTFNNGFAVLAHIVTYHSKLIIIEENLPDLNANDIKRAMIFKGIKSKLVIIKNTHEKLQGIEYIFSQCDTVLKRHLHS
ncbi:hypothetical protein FBALC1_04642 [Flavobacteriales bacterium ALC-1]|nr:hypothetical protein FBALC1_04642 [Flavobacteriales bacterium ALC-1]